jgi:hypothetical protein
MKKKITVTQPTQVVDEVVCDLTGKSCEVGIGSSLLDGYRHDPDWETTRFEYATLDFSGGYCGDYDMLRFQLHIHPSVAVALYALTLPEDERAELAETYNFPKVRLVVEE